MERQGTDAADESVALEHRLQQALVSMWTKRIVDSLKNPSMYKDWTAKKMRKPFVSLFCSCNVYPSVTLVFSCLQQLVFLRQMVVNALLDLLMADRKSLELQTPRLENSCSEVALRQRAEGSPHLLPNVPRGGTLVTPPRLLLWRSMLRTLPTADR